MIKSYNKHIKISWLTVLLIIISQISYSQDPTKLSLDTTWSFEPISFSMSSMSVEYSFSHSPSIDDTIICDKYNNLINSDPTDKNYSAFYSLACSIWELGKLKEAESMFLKIVDSKKPYYTDNYYHSTDISGDTTTNIYGYGSYTSNYKNYASRYLTKIYLEKQQYKLALKFIELTDKKYVVQQNCGTGYLWYRNEIDGLYSLCYDGLGMYDTIIEKYLPNYADYRNAILVKAIKKKYTQNEIYAYLTKAEISVVCIVDTFQSSSYTTYNYGNEDERTVESKYTSGIATIKLFGKEAILDEPSLENGEVVSREKFLKEFEKSGFYKALIE